MSPNKNWVSHYNFGHDGSSVIAPQNWVMESWSCLACAKSSAGTCSTSWSCHSVVPAIPQSEVLAKFFEEIGEKCGEILAKFFADFRPSISRENGRTKFHEKSWTFSTVHQLKFFHCCNSGGLGAQHSGKKKAHKHKLFGPVALGTPRECPGDNQGKTKGQQLKGKIVHNFSQFFALFGTFSEFFPQDFPLQNKGF